MASPRTDKDWTVTVISRATGRKRTWHTNKEPDLAKLWRDNWYVSTAYNRAIPIEAAELAAETAAETDALYFARVR